MNSAFVNSLRLSAMTAVAFAALSAQAADMYAPKVSMKDMPVPEFSWSGFYLGVNSGYGWGASHSTVYTDAFDATAFAATPAETFAAANTASLWTQGGFGGGQLGYNVQRDRFVFGVETDIQASAIKGAAVAEAAVFPAATFLLPSVMSEALTKSNLDWFGTVRARLGYSLGNTLFFGNTLVYATGGFAYGGVKDTLIAELTSTNTTTAGTTATAGSAVNWDSRNANLTGWVVGGGVEVALSPSWSAKAEYQYIDLGSTNLTAPTSLSYTPAGALAASTDLGASSVKIDHTYNTVRLGLNYRVNQAPEPLPLK
jgi:outer membrane immunogenic protein